MTAAHDQVITNHYTIHCPDHEPRKSDPHYKDFSAYRRKAKKDPELYQCAMGKQRGDFSECDLTAPLELHHSHVEFSLANDVDLVWLERDYPGISNRDEVGAWIESGANLVFLCRKCHRGSGGIHHASAADYEAEKYIRGLID